MSASTPPPERFSPTEQSVLADAPAFNQPNRINRAPGTLFPLTLLLSETYAMTDVDGTRYTWDVTLGRSLAEARGADTFAFHPAEHGITPEHVRARYPDINEEYAAALTDDDLARPLLFLPFRGKHLLVDGWHRIWRCITGAPSEAPPCLPAYLLTETEANNILIGHVPADAGGASQTEDPIR